jgi:hypothetical protein
VHLVTLIDAQRALDFVELVGSLATDNAYHDPEYQRGAGEATRMIRLYLETLMDDPTADRFPFEAAA